METNRPENSLLSQAQRLRIYLGESDRWRGKALYAALLEVLKAHGLAGATVLRGVAGFGAHSRIHTAAILRLSEDLPLVIDVIDSPEKIAQALEAIYPMVREGLITLEDVRVVKYTHRYLHPLPADRLVSEVMTREVRWLAPDLPVQVAWARMLAEGLKVFPVVDEQQRVVGILTDEDLLERAGVQQRLAVASRLDAAIVREELGRLGASPLRVADVMSRAVITAAAGEPLGAAAARMVKAGLKRLPVVDAGGALVGMLSRLDVLRQVSPAPAGSLPEPAAAQAALTLGEVMTANVPAAGLQDDLNTLVEKFSASGSHRLVVVDAAGRAVGLISDSDVVARLQPEQQKPMLAALRRAGRPPEGGETAAQLMSPQPLTAPPDCPLAEGVRRMLADSRKWLVVVDAAGRPVGLVDRRILLAALAPPYAG